MISILLAALAFLALLAGAAVGMVLRRRLPERHLSRESTDVIKLAIGLMASLVALVLGLLISSANSFRVQVADEYGQAVAGIFQLDQRLRAYGPETGDARALLRRIVTAGAAQRWPHETFDSLSPLDGPMPAAVLDLERRIVRLQPANDEQKYFQAQALQLANTLIQIHRLISNQAGAIGISLPILIGVIFCSVAIFGGFSLFVEPNPTVITALCVAALAVAGAVFLIVELAGPFGGVLQLPSAPMRMMLTALAA
jgi:hypothetical protein